MRIKKLDQKEFNLFTSYNSTPQRKQKHIDVYNNETEDQAVNRRKKGKESLNKIVRKSLERSGGENV